jgi:hypothetical protein
VYHPDQIRAGLRTAGFEVIDKDAFNKDSTNTQTIDRCGWQRLATYSKSSVRRGTFDVYGTPEPGIFKKVGSVMIHAYPFAEITLILCFLVAPIGGLIVLGWYTSYNDTKKNQRKKQMPRKCLRTKIKDWQYERTDPEKLTFHPTSLGDSKLLHMLPTEIHLDILDALPYSDLKAMRATCRFYYSLSPKNKLADMQERWKNLMISHEQNQRIRRDQLPCFTCLDIKPLTSYIYREQVKQTMIISSNSALTYSNDARKCIDCMVNDCKDKNGLSPFKVTRIESMYVCGCCGSRVYTRDDKAGHKMKDGGYWCADCYKKNGCNLDMAFQIRVPQFLFAFITFCISFTGNVSLFLCPASVELIIQ